MSIKVKFVHQTKISKSKTALKAAKEAKVKINDACDGKGKCGKCVVKILEGEVSAPTKQELRILGEEKIKKGYRLACEVEIVGNTSMKVVK